jgi:integrase
MRGCRPLTDFEIQRLLDLLSAPNWYCARALIVLGLRTGMRLTSMLRLRIGDVADNSGKIRSRIHVRRSTVKGKTAGYSIPAHAQLKVSLQAHIDTLTDRRPGAFVFPGRKAGKHIHRVTGWRIFVAVLEELEIAGARGELGVHALRKTFARQIHKNLGYDIVKTKQALRHASITTTIDYLSFDEEEIDAAILRL